MNNREINTIKKELEYRLDVTVFEYEGVLKIQPNNSAYDVRFEIQKSHDYFVLWEFDGKWYILAEFRCSSCNTCYTIALDFASIILKEHGGLSR